MSWIPPLIFGTMFGVFFSRMIKRYPVLQQKWWTLGLFLLICAAASDGAYTLYRCVMGYSRFLNTIIHVPDIKFDIVAIYGLCLVRFLFYRRQHLALYLMDACLAIVLVMIWID